MGHKKACTSQDTLGGIKFTYHPNSTLGAALHLYPTTVACQPVPELTKTSRLSTSPCSPAASIPPRPPLLPHTDLQGVPMQPASHLCLLKLAAKQVLALQQARHVVLHVVKHHVDAALFIVALVACERVGEQQRILSLSMLA